jgi:hypothetical protein
MQLMVLNSLLSEARLSFSEQLVVNANAVVGKSLPMAIVDALTDLQEFEVVLYGFFVLFYVIVEHADGVVGTTFIAHFTRPSAAEGEHFVIF